MNYQAPLYQEDPDASYTNADLAGGTPGSYPPAEAMEHPQREIIEVIQEAGLTPDSEDLTQLSQAIQLLISSPTSVVTDISSSNLNVLVETGAYRGQNLSNAPAALGSAWAYVEVLKDVNNVTQRLTTMTATPSSVFIRQKIGAVWGTWMQQARLSSPEFSDAPTAPTQNPGDNSNKLATTEYVDSAVAAMPAPVLAWVRFDASGVLTINDSFNVTSVTDNGVGDYTINYTVNMPNANYGVVGLASGDTTARAIMVKENSLPTVSSVRVICRYIAPSAGAKNDCNCITVAILASE